MIKPLFLCMFGYIEETDLFLPCCILKSHSIDPTYPQGDITTDQENDFFVRKVLECILQSTRLNSTPSQRKAGYFGPEWEAQKYKDGKAFNNEKNK